MEHEAKESESKPMGASTHNDDPRMVASRHKSAHVPHTILRDLDQPRTRYSCSLLAVQLSASLTKIRTLVTWYCHRPRNSATSITLACQLRITHRSRSSAEGCSLSDSAGDDSVNRSLANSVETDLHVDELAPHYAFGGFVVRNGESDGMIRAHDTYVGV